MANNIDEEAQRETVDRLNRKTAALAEMLNAANAATELAKAAGNAVKLASRRAASL